MNDDSIRDLIEQVEQKLSGLGIHIQDVNIMGRMTDGEEGETPSDMGEVATMIKDGGGEFALAIQANLGGLAWDDRTLHPEHFDADILLAEAGMSPEMQRKHHIQQQLDDGVAFEDLDLGDL